MIHHSAKPPAQTPSQPSNPRNKHKRPHPAPTRPISFPDPRLSQYMAVDLQIPACHSYFPPEVPVPWHSRICASCHSGRQGPRSDRPAFPFPLRQAQRAARLPRPCMTPSCTLSSSTLSGRHLSSPHPSPRSITSHRGPSPGRARRGLTSSRTDQDVGATPVAEQPTHTHIAPGWEVRRPPPAVIPGGLSAGSEKGRGEGTRRPPASP